MVNVAATLTFGAADPKRNTVTSRALTNVNSAEWNRADYTIPADYAQLRIRSMAFTGEGAQTLPAFANGEVVVVFVVRGNAVLHGPINSKPTGFYADGAAAAQITWDMWADDLREFPNLLPGDVLQVYTPPIDDGGAPTGDLRHTIVFTVIQR